MAKPTWAVHRGKAEVNDDGENIEIFAYYDGDAAIGPKNAREIARIIIRGKIGPDHTIGATGTLLNTDAIPWKLSGRYTVRKERELWGTRYKVVTYKEVIFDNPPNAVFLGFLGRDIQGE